MYYFSLKKKKNYFLSLYVYQKEINQRKVKLTQPDKRPIRWSGRNRGLHCWKQLHPALVQVWSEYIKKISCYTHISNNCTIIINTKSIDTLCISISIMIGQMTGCSKKIGYIYFSEEKKQEKKTKKNRKIHCIYLYYKKIHKVKCGNVITLYVGKCTQKFVYKTVI